MTTALRLVRSHQTFRDSRLKTISGRAIACWYGGVEPNRSQNSIPLINVFFRRLTDDNVLSGRAFPVTLTITSLGQVRIGSVWEDGRSCYSIKLQQADFHVDFTTDSESFTSLKDAHDNNKPSPIEADQFLLPNNKEHSWLLNLPIPGDSRNILIPCWEVFYRLYGVSAEVKRILATYPWSIASERLYRPHDEEASDDSWPIRLAKNMYDGDATFVGHLVYNEYARRAACRIHSDLDMSWSKNRQRYPERHKTLAFTKIGPWFQGPAQIRLQGLWINNGKTFLGLRINGHSYPPSPTIRYDRENSNNTGDSASDDEAQQAWGGSALQQSDHPTEHIDHTNDMPPGHGSSSVEISDPSIAILGVPPNTEKVRRASSASKSLGGRQNAPAQEHSTDAPYGGDQTIGGLSIAPDVYLESQGPLRDIWNAFVYLSDYAGDAIEHVDWFTYGKQFQSSDTPELVPFELFDPGEYPELEAGVKSWPTITAGTSKVRGALIIRIQTPRTTFYVIEIQRRPHGYDEKFQGLAISAKQGEFLKTILPQFMAGVRHTKGVVKHLSGKFDYPCITFSHRPSAYDDVPLERTATRVLDEMTGAYA